MLVVLLHVGWDTFGGAAVFWLSWFIVAFLIVRWAIRKGKIAPPRGWFARGLLGGWALLLIGTLLFFLLASLAPGHWGAQFIYVLWLLSIFVVLGTFVYAAVFGVRRFWYYLSRLRNEAKFASKIGPLERVLVAGWVVFVMAALGSLPLLRYKWVQTFGAEILFFILAVVLLSSTLYASYVLIRRVREHLSR